MRRTSQTERVPPNLEQLPSGSELLVTRVEQHNSIRPLVYVAYDGSEVVLLLSNRLVHHAQVGALRAGANLQIDKYNVLEVDGDVGVFMWAGRLDGRIMQEDLPHNRNPPAKLARRARDDCEESFVDFAQASQTQFGVTCRLAAQAVVTSVFGRREYTNTRRTGSYSSVELTDKENRVVRVTAFDEDQQRVTLDLGSVVYVRGLQYKQSINERLFREATCQKHSQLSVASAHDASKVLRLGTLRDVTAVHLDAVLVVGAPHDHDGGKRFWAQDRSSTTRHAVRIVGYMNGRLEAQMIVGTLVRLFHVSADKSERATWSVPGNCVQLVAGSVESRPWVAHRLKALRPAEYANSGCVPLCSLQSAVDGCSGDPAKLTVSAYVQHVRSSDSLVYLASPATKRKLSDVEGDQGFCATSGARIPGVWKWCLRLCVVDASGNLDVHLFDEVAVPLLEGLSAKEALRLAERDVGESSTQQKSTLEAVQDRVCDMLCAARLRLVCEVSQHSVVCRSARRYSDSATPDLWALDGNCALHSIARLRRGSMLGAQ